MSGRHHRASGWPLFVFAAALLLCIGGLPSTFGQVPNFTKDFTKPDRSPDPPTNVRRPSSKRPDTRARQTSSNLPPSTPDARLDEKQQEIERAIEQGNQARNVNDYEQALSHYQKARDLNSQEARAFYGMGNLYTDLYCSDSAIVAYQKALELKKDYLEALTALGYAYLSKERYGDAEKRFQEALNLSPNNVGASLGMGSVFTRQGKYQEAIKRINLVIEAPSTENKDRAVAFITLGMVYEGQGKRKEAIAQYEKAINLYPNERANSLNPTLAAVYLQLGSTQTTDAYLNLPVFESADKVSPQDMAAMRSSAKQATDNLERAREHGYNHPSLYALLGLALTYQFRYQDAATQINVYFDKVKELESRLSPVAANCNAGFNQLKANGRWYLGHVYTMEADFESDKQRKTELLNKAIEQFNQATQLKQDDVNAYWSMATNYYKQEKYEEAISQYKNAIRYGIEEKYRATIYDTLGLAYSKQGRAAEAIENIREAIKLEPNRPQYHESLASIYVSQGNLEETFNSLKMATELRTKQETEPGAKPSTNPNPYYYLGATYSIRFIKAKKEEDFNEAVKWLKIAIGIKPNSATYHRALGLTYDAHSNADEALASYKKASEYDPKNPSNYIDMADVYSNLKNNHDAAIGLLKQAIEIKPDHAGAYRNLGVMYQRKKNITEAIKHLLKAIELDPKQLGAHLELASLYRAEKNYPEAIKHLEKAIEIAPTDFGPYKEMAKFYEDQGKNEDAVHYYEEAINRLNAADTVAKNLYLGRIARLRGRYAEAIGYFQKVNFPDEPGRTQYEIGMTYVASKNKSAALEQYQQLVQLKSPLAEELLKKIKEMK